MLTWSVSCLPVRRRARASAKEKPRPRHRPGGQADGQPVASFVASLLIEVLAFRRLGRSFGGRTESNYRSFIRGYHSGLDPHFLADFPPVVAIPFVLRYPTGKSSFPGADLRPGIGNARDHPSSVDTNQIE